MKLIGLKCAAIKPVQARDTWVSLKGEQPAVSTVEHEGNWSLSQVAVLWGSCWPHHSVTESWAQNETREQKPI